MSTVPWGAPKSNRQIRWRHFLIFYLQVEQYWHSCRQQHMPGKKKCHLPKLMRAGLWQWIGTNHSQVCCASETAEMLPQCGVLLYGSVIWHGIRVLISSCTQYLPHNNQCHMWKKNWLSSWYFNQRKTRVTKTGTVPGHDCFLPSRSFAGQLSHSWIRFMPGLACICTWSNTVGGDVDELVFQFRAPLRRCRAHPCTVESSVSPLSPVMLRFRDDNNFNIYHVQPCLGLRVGRMP